MNETRIRQLLSDSGFVRAYEKPQEHRDFGLTWHDREGSLSLSIRHGDIDRCFNFYWDIGGSVSSTRTCCETIIISIPQIMATLEKVREDHATLTELETFRAIVAHEIGHAVSHACGKDSVDEELAWRNAEMLIADPGAESWMTLKRHAFETYKPPGNRLPTSVVKQLKTTCNCPSCPVPPPQLQHDLVVKYDCVWSDWLYWCRTCERQYLGRHKKRTLVALWQVDEDNKMDVSLNVPQPRQRREEQRRALAELVQSMENRAV